LIQRFKGRAHWGKNDGSLFELQKKMNSYGDRLGRFKAIMNQFDPHGVLSNEFVKYF